MGLPIPIIGDLLDELGEVAKQVLPNPQARREFDLKLAEIKDRAEQRLHEQVMGQVEVNRVEASHRSIWVAGWRPFVGWVAGLGIAWTFVLAPLVEWLSRLFGWKGAMPEVDVGQLMTLVLAMLGVAGMRSFDKAKGTANDTPLGRTIVEQAHTEIAASAGGITERGQVAEAPAPARPKKGKKLFGIKLPKL